MPELLSPLPPAVTASAPAADPGTPPWFRRLFLGTFVLAAWLMLFDKYVQNAREFYMWLAVAALVLLDAWRGDRTVSLPKRLVTTAGLLTAGLLAAELLRKGVDRPEISRRDALYALGRFHGYAFWGATAWLYSPLLLSGERRTRPGLFWLATLVTALTGWSFATALASVRPDISFRYFGREIGIYAPLVLAWLRHAPAMPQLQGKLKQWGLAVLAAGTLLGFCVALAYIVGPQELKAELEKPRMEFSDVILREQVQPGRWEWRLSFPFGHHNRMAFFSMVAVLGLGMAGATRANPGGRAALACWAGAAAAAMNLAMTLNRGVMVALAAAVPVIVLFRLGWRRTRWVLVALPTVLPLAFLALPDELERRLTSLAEARTYTDPGSTVAARFQHWRAATLMISANPVAGIGYGWRNFENHYQTVISRRMGLTQAEAVHAHNLWLQTAAETGLPGLVLWISFTLVRWGLLAAAWRNRHRLPPGTYYTLVLWTGLEVALQVYCLGNLPLRRSLGILTWGCWTLMAVDTLRMSGELPPEAGRPGPEIGKSTL